MKSRHESHWLAVYGDGFSNLDSILADNDLHGDCLHGICHYHWCGIRAYNEKPDTCLIPICQAVYFFFRAVPTLVQLFLIYFGLPWLFPAMTSMDALTAVIIGLSIKNSAYLAEIFRAALNSVDEELTWGLFICRHDKMAVLRQNYFPAGRQKCHSSDGEYLYWTFKRNIACLYHWGGRNVCARENDCIGQL